MVTQVRAFVTVRQLCTYKLYLLLNVNYISIKKETNKNQDRRPEKKTRGF